jgi:hypothetical protein
VSTRVTYDGLERVTFEGRTYHGWEQAVTVPDGALRDIGAGTEVHAYVADARVYAIDGIDPASFVVMRGGEAFGGAPILFATQGALDAAADHDFGKVYPELCPYLRMLELRYGCPGAPTRPPFEPGV